MIQQPLFWVFICNLKRYMHPHVHSALLTISKAWKNLNVHGWVNG